MPITATSRRTGGPLRCEVELQGGHAVVVDEPGDHGGEDSAPTPQQLLAAALASCVSITMEMYARRKGWDLADARVDVSFDKQAARFEVAVHLPEHLDAEQRERVLRIASRCPVHRLLEQGATVTDSAVEQ
jgi:putative redox protein